MKFPKLITTCLCSLFLFSLSAQKIDLEEFNGINIAAGLKVQLIASDKNYADIEMIRGDRDDIKINVKNGTLRL